MGKGPLELEGCPCIFAQGPPSSKLRYWLYNMSVAGIRVVEFGTKAILRYKALTGRLIC